jgi:hypothetical protein
MGDGGLQESIKAMLCVNSRKNTNIAQLSLSNNYSIPL